MEVVIPARGKGLVGTGLAVAVPAGTCTFVLSDWVFYRERVVKV